MFVIYRKRSNNLLYHTLTSWTDQQRSDNPQKHFDRDGPQKEWSAELTLVNGKWYTNEVTLIQLFFKIFNANDILEILKLQAELHQLANYPLASSELPLTGIVSRDFAILFLI
jgi:hypothetical protein